MSTERPVLITSLMPKLSRLQKGSEVGIEYQRACVKSWLRTGFKVISVNPAQEIDELKKTGYEVEFLPSQNVGAPQIMELVRVAVESRAEICGFINSDCMLFDEAVRRTAFIELRQGGVFLLGERVDVSPESGASMPSWAKGFDLFLFRPHDLIAMKLYSGYSPYRLGDPWWDYWFPLVACSSGLKLKRFALPVVSHIDHAKNWNYSRYLTNGLIFKDELVRLSAQTSANTDFVRFAEAALVGPSEDIGKLAEFTYRWLWDSPPRKLVGVFSDTGEVIEDYCSKAIAVTRLVQSNMPLHQLGEAEIESLDIALRHARSVFEAELKTRQITLITSQNSAATLQTSEADLKYSGSVLKEIEKTIRRWNRRRLQYRRLRRETR